MSLKSSWGWISETIFSLSVISDIFFEISSFSTSFSIWGPILDFIIPVGTFPFLNPETSNVSCFCKILSEIIFSIVTLSKLTSYWDKWSFFQLIYNSFFFPFIWCGWRDSNSHRLLRWYLKPVRLPFRHIRASLY